MEGFNCVAIVNFVEDNYSKKDYAFALYDEERKFVNINSLVVVNPLGKNRRALATIVDIVSVEDWKGGKITAEVVGVVNMDNYFAREDERIRIKELAEKKAAIEKELEKEINKRKSVEYYEEMATKYSDNPRLAELVVELKKLSE